MEDDVNSIDTYGGRAALRVDLDDSWTVTPSIIYQKQKSRGSFAYRPTLGDLRNARYALDSTRDRWFQAAMVIEGKIGRFDVTYAGAYFERTAQYVSDYSDYAFFYDSYYAATPDYFGNNFFDNAGTLIDPSQITTNDENFTKQSHELRIASPSEEPFRFVAGLFYQRQTNDWENLYTVPGLADAQSVTGLPGVNYANIQFRTDRDYAAFAQASYDIVEGLTLTGGLRAYQYDNDVVGFFGYNGDRSPVGEALCIPETIGTVGNRKPCDNIDAQAKGSGIRHKLGLSYQVDAERLVYATWSTGFRPGGINRRPTAAAYQPEELSNYEIGWKTSWFDRRLRINGALFVEKLTQAQFGINSDQNGITDIVNAGRAESRGIEGDISWVPITGLTLSTSATYVDAKLKTNLCQYANPEFDCSIPSAGGSDNATTAPAGTRFPTTPRFKLTATARYEFALRGVDVHFQGSAFHQSSVQPTLTVSERPLLGIQPGYTTFDLSTGVARDGWSAELSVENAFDKRGQSLRYASCKIELCGPTSIQIVPIQPRFVSLRVARRF